MKKILLISSLLFAISCTHLNQEVNLDVTLLQSQSSVGTNVTLDLKVIDDRQIKDLIGIKKFGDEKITITAKEDLTNFVRQEITKGLEQKGFKIGKGKAVEIHIEKFQYKAKRKFFIGKSVADGSMKVVISNNKTGAKFSKNYSLSIDGSHFIMPLETTDAKIINSLLQDLLQDILSDEDLTKALNS